MSIPIQGLPVSGVGDIRPSSPGASSKNTFSSTLQDAFKKVDELQTDADQRVSAMLEGSGQDIHSAMIAVERADLSFQLMLQVRNKIVNAYQEVARMQF